MSSIAIQATTKRQRIVGRTLSGLAVAFLLLDAVMKFVKPQQVVDATLELGFPEHSIPLMGVSLLVSTLLYLLPRTALLGAILVTGYLGGAVAAHVRIDHPLFTHTLFPFYVAFSLWGGLYLRDARVRAAFASQSREMR